MNDHRKIIVINDNDNDNVLHAKKYSDIIYLESIGKKTKTHCCEGKEYLIKKSLSFVEETLPCEKFFKIHKSIIINIDYLKSININPEKTVLLHDDIRLNIAYRKYKDFMDFLKTKFDIWQ
jgi:two-component system, LytTR family, response regulator